MMSVSSGGTIEKEVSFKLADAPSLRLSLRNRGGALTDEYPIAATAEPSAFTFLPLLPEGPGVAHEPRGQCRRVFRAQPFL